MWRAVHSTLSKSVNISHWFPWYHRFLPCYWWPSYTGSSIQHGFQSADLTSNDYGVTFGPGNEHDTEPYDFEILHQHRPLNTSTFSVGESQQQSPTVLCAPSEEDPQQQQPKAVTMHHGSCLDDMISRFLDLAVLTQPLIFKQLLPDNTGDNGTGLGVAKYVYSSFWK